MRFCVPIGIVLLLSSCLNEEQRNEILNPDTSGVVEESDVDTFFVARGSEVFSNETPEGDSLKAENDTARENIRLTLLGGQSNEENSEVSTVVKNPDIAPGFPGGNTAMDAYIRKNLVYPYMAFQNDVVGTCNVRFVVEPDGRLTGITVYKGLGFGCDEAAVDLIKNMPKWTPGKKAGIAVRCSVVLPITFSRPE
jgi:protein TonB